MRHLGNMLLTAVIVAGFMAGYFLLIAVLEALGVSME